MSDHSSGRDELETSDMLGIGCSGQPKIRNCCSESSVTGDGKVNMVKDVQQDVPLLFTRAVFN